MNIGGYHYMCRYNYNVAIFRVLEYRMVYGYVDVEYSLCVGFMEGACRGK